MTIKNTKFIRRLFSQSNVFFAVLIFFSITLIPFQFAAAHSHKCKTEPFSKRIRVGKTVGFAVTLFPSARENLFELQTGSLPHDVESSFAKFNHLLRAPFETTLFFTPKSTAEAGSFTIPVIYREFSPNKISDGENDALCRLNLIIDPEIVPSEKNKNIRVVPSAPKPTPVGSETGHSSKKVVSGTDLGGVAPEFKISLRRGDKSTFVIHLQELLIKIGLFPKDVGATGFFGAITQEVVKNFQRQNGIQETGMVGPLTRAALNAVFDK